MPVIEGADLTSVSTEREPLPECEIVGTISSAGFDDSKKMIVIKHTINDATVDLKGQKEWWDWINVKKNDGELNPYGLADIKRYMEAVFGKGSPEAEATPPDTDILVGSQVRHILGIEEFVRKDGTKGKKNVSKRVLKA